LIIHTISDWTVQPEYLKDNSTQCIKEVIINYLPNTARGNVSLKNLGLIKEQSIACQLSGR